MPEFKRSCPMCNIEIIYRKRKYLIAAIINNAECRHCYNAHNNLNKKFSSEHKTRLRLSAIKRIEDRNGIIWPNYNIEACKIILPKCPIYYKFATNLNFMSFIIVIAITTF